MLGVTVHPSLSSVLLLRSKSKGENHEEFNYPSLKVIIYVRFDPVRFKRVNGQMQYQFWN